MATTSGTGRKGSRYHRLDNIPTNTFTPRTYQIQLLDAALQRNTLLCLGCPSSKLFLALMVAKEMSSVIRPAPTDGGMRTFYLTDTEEEAEAVSSTLPHHTDLKIGHCLPPSSQVKEQVEDACEGTDPTEGSSFISHGSSTWLQLIEDNNIVVCTGVQLLEALRKNYVRLKDVNLLIFDDCHRAVEGEECGEFHPYAEIVSLVQQMGARGDTEPRLLGVTAAIAGTDCSDPDQLRTTISAMERTMHAQAQTSMLILTERFGCRPRQQVVRCDLEDLDPVGVDEEQAELRHALEDLLLRDYHFFLDCQEQLIEQAGGKDPGETPRQVLEQCLTILSMLGPWCCSSVGEYFHMQLEKIVKLERCDVHKRCLRCVMTTLRRLTRTFERGFHPDYCVHQFLAYTTPKVRALVNSLRRFKPEVDFIIISNGGDDPDDEDLSDLSDDGDDDEDDDDDSLSGSDMDEDGQNQTSSPSSSKPVHIAVKRTADGGTERVTGFFEEEEKNLCGIVFVENRYIAFGLSKVIEEVCSWDEDLCFVKSCHITGQGLKGSAGTSKQQRSNRACKRQEEALRKFRTQEVNLVIATPELEEGIDIPKCNLVVRFDPPKDYRSYTLSKGRARARDASFIILLDADTYEGFQSRLEVFRGIEQVLLGDSKLQPQLREKEEDKDGDTEEGEEDLDEDSSGEPLDQDVLPAYRTIPSSPTSPQVTMQGAIALVNRYCAKLPSDAFTHLTPQCRLQSMSGQYVAFLRLPINSPVKQELQGPAMKTKKLAKMAVALKMCEILHKKGELDDQLLPVGKEMFVYEEEEEWADEDDAAGQARPGTTKRKQYYTKKVADAMLESLPKPEQASFLYLISLRLTGPITDEQNTRGRLIYAPEDTQQTLGLLLNKPIPQMPSFPVYTRSGEVTASVDLLRSDLALSAADILRLHKFHYFVFSGVLHLEKDPMEFDPEQADYGCVAVPLNGGDNIEIDWEFVDKVIQFMPSQKRADATTKRKRGPVRMCKSTEDKENSSKFTFRIEDFEDAVVMPSYRNMDQPQHFYVAEIRTDLNPLSPFPSPELYKTFQDYYTTKYGLEISCKDQPLLDVDHTSARLNLLTPRYMNPKGMALPTSSAETKRARRENLQQKQILVPELCDVHIFPASLWRKAVCLPAILYRTNCLLLAEELRQRVARQTGIGQEILAPGFRFPQLDFGFETSPEKLMEAESSSGASTKSSLSYRVRDEDSESPTSSPEKHQQGAEPIEKSSPEQRRCEDSQTSAAKSDETTATEDKRSSPTILTPDTATDGSVDKADSAASSDTDSGIMSSGSDNNLGPSPSTVATVSDGDPSRTGDFEKSSTCERSSASSVKVTREQSNPLPANGADDAALSQPSVIASSPSTLLGQASTRSSIDAALHSSAIEHTTTSSTADSVWPTSIGANHSTHVSHDIDIAAMLASSPTLHAEKIAFPSSGGGSTAKAITITENVSKPITADTCVISSSNSSNKCNNHEPQGLTAAATNVPCPPLSSTASLLRIPYSSVPSFSSSSSSSPSPTSTASVSLQSSSDIQGCEPPHALITTHLQTISTESPQKSSSHPHPSQQLPNSTPSSTQQNHPVCVQQNSSDNAKLAAVSDEKADQSQHSKKVYNSAEAAASLQEKGTLKAKTTSQNPSPSKTEPRLEEVKSNSASNFKSSSNTAWSAPSPPAHSSEAAIVMNTLGVELSGLDIDLICPAAPHNNCSSTFQASDSTEVPGGNHPPSTNTGMSVEDEFVHQFKEGDPLKSQSPSTDTEFVDAKNTATNDADIIKFSFNADAPENSGSAREEEVVIGTWGKDEESKSKHKTVREKKQAFEQTKPSTKNNKCKESIAKAENKNMNKDFLAEKFSRASSGTKSQQPHNPGGLDLPVQPIHKDFDIGVWNVRKPNQFLTEASTADYLFASQGPVTRSSPSPGSSAPSSSTCHMSLDEDRDFSSFPGPSPCLLLQALTMSNANDFFSLERLETIGDSFLKYAITVYLYCCYPGIHEGKLSYLRSKQVSNYNLYRLGRRKWLAERMVATKFEPYENWLPPGFVINEERRRGPVPKVAVVPSGPREESGTTGSSSRRSVPQQQWPEDSGGKQEDEAGQFRAELAWLQHIQEQDQREEAGGATSVSSGAGGGGGSAGIGLGGTGSGGGLIPYSLQQHHGLPDKSLADCVEALIGCYLTTCGRKAALLFMSWLGLRVLPKRTGTAKEEEDSPPWKVNERQFAELRCPPSPMFFPTEENKAKLEKLLEGFSDLEDTIQYKFRDRSYLLQAFTHASYHYNTITDCYQRIEFLGDAILDYVITRHLYEDSQKHSPGILTDLRSALVNNNIFAALAVKWGFHKYFKAVSPALFQVIDTFVKFQEGKDQDHIDIDEEYQEVSMEEPIPEEGGEDEEEDEEEEVEMEIPKALGDIFESVAGAIYLDSGMSLDAVWTVYYRMMKPHIDKYLKSIPKSPVRELLETEPETAKFERPQRTVNGKVRVTVNVVGKGEFSGVGRNYRIAKSAAAKRALRSIRFMAQNLS